MIFVSLIGESAQLYVVVVTVFVKPSTVPFVMKDITIMPTKNITTSKYVRLLNIYNESSYNYMANPLIINLGTVSNQ